MKLLVLLSVALAAVAAGTSSASALEEEVQAYQRALSQVCQRSVTPELVRLYEIAVKGMDRARAGYGRDSNFWGLRAPELAYNDCFQAPAPPRR